MRVTNERVAERCSNIEARCLSFGIEPSENSACVLDLRDERALADKLAEALEDFGRHGARCVLSGWREGRPTAGGGYETNYDGTWYETRPVDKTPSCSCGLSDALAAYDKERGR